MTKKGGMEHCYYVYILSNTHHTVFYTGMTNDLIRRMYEHREKLIRGFTEQYNVSKLLYFEIFSDVNEAIHREKQIKRWTRAIKFDAITRLNPEWVDLYASLVGDPGTSPG